MEITADIAYVGVNDHAIDLFEGQYVVPRGMAYNSYFVKDAKTAVMDTVDARFGDEWLKNVAAADGGKARLVRPLWGCRKPAIHAVAQLFGFPKIRSCPYEKVLRERGDRHFVGELLAKLQTRFPDLHAAMRHSMGDLRLAHLLDHRFRNQPDPDAGKL